MDAKFFLRKEDKVEQEKKEKEKKEKGIKEARETFKYDDGAEYNGEWLNEKREGWGTVTWPDGS